MGIEQHVVCWQRHVRADSGQPDDQQRRLHVCDREQLHEQQVDVAEWDWTGHGGERKWGAARALQRAERHRLVWKRHAAERDVGWGVRGMQLDS